jgi:ATP-dependent Lon protease
MLKSKYALLPLRDVCIYPHMIVPLFVGREKSIEALEFCSKKNQMIFLATQKDSSIINPSEKDLYEHGTVAQILQLIKLPDGTLKILIEGKRRAKIIQFSEEVDFNYVEVTDVIDEIKDEKYLIALFKTLKEAFEKYCDDSNKIPADIFQSLIQLTDYSKFADLISANLILTMEEKQYLLQETVLENRLQKVLEKVHGEIEIIKMEKKIKDRVSDQLKKYQKEYYLNEQMNAIQKELGNKEELTDIQELEKKIQEKKFSLEIKEKVLKELKKLKAMPPMSAEGIVVKNYIDWMLSLPWNEYSQDEESLEKSKNILENDHYGLEEAKDRLLEFLAVQKLLHTSSEGKGIILCLAGPPGVGKTSIGKSLAKALNRKFARISLGGIRDEAEIRGHRRTYVGSMPGKIIQAIKKAGTSNPVILLDEIDKMSSDFRGDPSAALLEVLDPEQNNTFADHYIECEYDLSQVIFIMTANNIFAIPEALKDRMEIINLAGYTPFEKLEITKKYLIEKNKKMHGLEKITINFEENALMELISFYTRESGVRECQRLISKIFRKIAKKVFLDKETSFSINKSNLSSYLGPALFQQKLITGSPEIGLVNGLAWTSVGGEILFLEALSLPGKGELILTGKLGETMVESIKAAYSLSMLYSMKLGLDESWFTKHNIHLHIPEAAVPKDGPSAGITIFTTFMSLFLQKPVNRFLAMTGEISLRGFVLPIGGLKEKLLAAKNSGITHVLIPDCQLIGFLLHLAKWSTWEPIKANKAGF